MANRPPLREALVVTWSRAEPVEPAHDGEVEIGERVTVLDLTVPLPLEEPLPRRVGERLLLAPCHRPEHRRWEPKPPWGVDPI